MTGNETGDSPVSGKYNHPMRLFADKLQGDLERSIRPAYLIHGEEPLGIAEAGDRIRAAVRNAGYHEREVIFVLSDSDWEQVRQSADSLSLFAERKLLDVRIPSGKPGRKGGEVIRDLMNQPPPDLCYLFTLPGLDRSGRNSAWFKAIDKVGVHIESRVPDLRQLNAWLVSRLRHLGLSIDDTALQRLTLHLEGNLLSAFQETEMLALLFPGQKITEDEVLSLVTRSARYPLGAAAEAALTGDAERALTVLDGLREESVPEVLVLWSFSQQIRAGSRLEQAISRGKSPGVAFREAGVWQNQQPLMRDALKRHNELTWIAMLAKTTRIERLIKGIGQGDPWQEFRGLCVMLAGDGSPALQDSRLIAGSI